MKYSFVFNRKEELLFAKTEIDYSYNDRDE